MKRIYHSWDKWECYPAGFYESTPRDKNLTKLQCEQKYAEFLRSDTMFCSALERVIVEWKNSCEHYLSNENMNRIAWLGQASLCIAEGIPACFRGGYNLLTIEEQQNADSIALKYLNKWLSNDNFLNENS